MEHSGWVGEGSIPSLANTYTTPISYEFNHCKTFTKEKLVSFQELNTHLETIRSKLESMTSTADNRHSATLTTVQQHLETISDRVIIIDYF